MRKSTFKKHYELPNRDVFTERDLAQLLRQLYRDGKIKDTRITRVNAPQYATMIKCALIKAFSVLGGVSFQSVCSIKIDKWETSRNYLLKDKIYKRTPYRIRTRWNRGFMEEIRGDESKE